MSYKAAIICYKITQITFWNGECTLNNSALHFYSSILAHMSILNKFFQTALEYQIFEALKCAVLLFWSSNSVY